MAGRSARGRRVSQESSQQMRVPERHRRSLSQGGDDAVSDDTPRQPGVLQGSNNAVPTANSHLNNNIVGHASAVQGSAALSGHDALVPPIFHAGVEPPSHSNKRLGFLGERLGEKLLSSTSVSSSSTLRGTSTAPLLPRSHSRAESTNLLGLSRDATASPVASMSSSSSPMAKAHTSPSKVSIVDTF